MKSYYKIYKDRSTGEVTFSPLLVAPDNMRIGMRMLPKYGRPPHVFSEYHRCFRTRGEAEKALKIDRALAKLRAMPVDELRALALKTRLYLKLYFGTFGRVYEVVGVPKGMFNVCAKKRKRLSPLHVAKMLLFRAEFDSIRKKLEAKLGHASGPGVFK
jgi:hypothetical protein